MVRAWLIGMAKPMPMLPAWPWPEPSVRIAE